MEVGDWSGGASTFSPPQDCSGNFSHSPKLCSEIDQNHSPSNSSTMSIVPVDWRKWWDVFSLQKFAEQFLCPKTWEHVLISKILAKVALGGEEEISGKCVGKVWQSCARVWKLSQLRLSIALRCNLCTRSPYGLQKVWTMRWLRKKIIKKTIHLRYQNSLPLVSAPPIQ